MKVASKVAMGSGITIVLLVAVLLYDLSRVQRVNSVNRSLGEIGLRATTISLEQSRLLAQIDEFTRKQFVTHDIAYIVGLNDLHLSFWMHLSRLQSIDLSPTSRALIDRLDRLWYRYLSFFTRDAWSVDALENQSSDRQAALLSQIESLREQVEEIGKSAQADMTEQAALASQANARAHRLYWLVAGVAVLVSILILWLTVRAIDGPLTKLIEGTQAVSQGEFSYRLDSSGHDEFSRLAGSFNEMVERLGEAERVKKDFLSHVSHELKSPLASMEETTELLLDEIPGPLTAKQRRFLGLNLDSGRRLSAMISRILDLSRLEAGVMEYEFREHDLAAMVANVADEFEARARESAVEILYDRPAPTMIVVCDRDRMYQVLQNLVDNAMKASSAGQSIAIRVYRSEEAPKFASVEIADRGPGIEDQLKGSIFERFHQAAESKSSSPRKGVGLGLAICREIMQAHNGRVWVRDNPGGGSVFSILLPLASDCVIGNDIPDLAGVRSARV